MANEEEEAVWAAHNRKFQQTLNRDALRYRSRILGEDLIAVRGLSENPEAFKIRSQAFDEVRAEQQSIRRKKIIVWLCVALVFFAGMAFEWGLNQ